MQDDREQLRAANWNNYSSSRGGDGGGGNASSSSSSSSAAASIPIVVTLAHTSLSSTTIPTPIHVLVSRHTFLHVGLEGAVRRLHRFAPSTVSFGGLGKRVVVVEEPDIGSTTLTTMENGDGMEGKDDGRDDRGPNDDKWTRQDRDESDLNSAQPINKELNKESPYPICWFEDEVTQQPLRWQFFAGVLFDSIHPRQQLSHNRSWSSSSYLPWRIRLHFQSYPTQRLLELDLAAGVLTTVERTFKNSLKQALVLQHGNNKVALNMTKHSHEAVWMAIRTSNYGLYRPIVDDIQVKDDSQLMMVPVRLSIDPTKPMIQRRCDYTVVMGSTNVTTGGHKEIDGGPAPTETTSSSDIPTLTLGSLLCDWAPQYFETTTETILTTSDGEHGPSSVVVVRAKRPESTLWRVAGITPPLSTPLVMLWRLFCHPDNFLYISVVVPTDERQQ